MAIQYAGGTIINTVYTTGATTGSPDCEATLISNTVGLPAAGWSLSQVAANGFASFSGQPANNDTLTLDSAPNNKTYRFVNALSVANDVLIDATLAQTIANLQNAIIAGPGAGTKYGTGTTAHATFTVPSITSTQINFAYVASSTGSAGNGAPMSKSSTAITLSGSTLSGGANILSSAITPAGLRFVVKVFTNSGSFYNPGTQLNVQVKDAQQTTTIKDLASGAAVANNTQFRLIANKYQFFHFTTGGRSVSSPMGASACGVPYIPSWLNPFQIPAATNTSPISINLPNHGYTTNQQVFIDGAQGLTAMNGTWTITVTDANNFTLNTSVGNGTYIGNTGFLANITLKDRLAQAIWAVSSGLGIVTTLYNSLVSPDGPGTMTNGTPVNPASNATIMFWKMTAAQLSNVPMQWYNNNYSFLEPLIAWGTSAVSNAVFMGQLWDSVLFKVALTYDQAAAFDSPAHNFLTVFVDTALVGSVLVATS